MAAGSYPLSLLEVDDDVPMFAASDRTISRCSVVAKNWAQSYVAIQLDSNRTKGTMVNQSGADRSHSEARPARYCYAWAVGAVHRPRYTPACPSKRRRTRPASREVHRFGVAACVHAGSPSRVFAQDSLCAFGMSRRSSDAHAGLVEL